MDGNLLIVDFEFQSEHNFVIVKRRDLAKYITSEKFKKDCTKYFRNNEGLHWLYYDSTRATNWHITAHPEDYLDRKYFPYMTDECDSYLIIYTPKDAIFSDPMME